jgi:hypothetical protein
MTREAGISAGVLALGVSVGVVTAEGPTALTDCEVDDGCFPVVEAVCEGGGAEDPGGGVGTGVERDGVVAGVGSAPLAAPGGFSVSTAVFLEVEPDADAVAAPLGPA